MDKAFLLAKNLINTTYEKLGSEAQKVTKKVILDSVSTAVGGSVAPGCSQVIELIKEWGGKEESSIWAFGGKVPAPFAALGNSTMAHALDYDDTHDRAVVHTGAVVVPTCFATAERKGKVSGKDFITAVALGIDLMSRLGLAATMGQVGGWHLTPVMGYFGAAGAASKILGLDEEQTVSALGLAYSQTAGNIQCVKDGALTKRLHPGLAAQGGIVSALLAQKGFTGAKNIFEGEQGFFKVYFQGECDIDQLTLELGKRFEVANLSFKPYPCCRYIHPYIDATLAIVNENSLLPENIEEVVIYAGEMAYSLCQPLEIKRSPRNVVEAQFSIPYAVANAIVRKRVVVENFEDKARGERSVLEMAQKVAPKLAQELSTREISPAIVKILARNGKTYTKRVDFALGDPRNPMSFDDIAAKLRACAAAAVKPLSGENAEKVVQMIACLEEVTDVADIVPLLS